MKSIYIGGGGGLTDNHEIEFLDMQEIKPFLTNHSLERSQSYYTDFSIVRSI